MTTSKHFTRNRAALLKNMIAGAIGLRRDGQITRPSGRKRQSDPYSAFAGAKGERTMNAANTLREVLKRTPTRLRRNLKPATNSAQLRLQKPAFVPLWRVPSFAIF